MYGVDYSDDEDDYDGFSTGFERRKLKSVSPEPENIDVQIETAALDGDLVTIQKFFSEDSNIKPDTVLAGRWTALMNAASRSQEHIVKYLLDQGADPMFSCEGVTPLMCACSSTSVHNIATVECVRTLLDKNVPKNVGDRYGTTALMRAVNTNKIDVVNLLLKGSNIEMKDALGRTAVFYAVENDDVDMLQILIKRGAKLNEVDKKGISLKNISLRRNYQPIIDILDKLVVEEEQSDASNSFLYFSEISWNDMVPNTSASNNKPAYSFEIPQLLNGMSCERLIPLFMEKGIDLETFLNYNDQSLLQAGVILPYDRLKIVSGLHNFFMRKWKIETVLGLGNIKKREFNSLDCLTSLASHLKHYTVLKSTIEYSAYRSSLENSEDVSSLECQKAEEQLLKEIHDSAYAIRQVKKSVLTMNKKKIVPSDLIVANNPLSEKSFKRVKLIFYAVTTLCLTTVFSFKYKPSLMLTPFKLLSPMAFK